MAIVYGVNYNKMYIAEPKELGDAGKQHTKMRVLSDNVTGNLGDLCYIGELPQGCIVLSAEVIGSATTVTLEDDSAVAIAIGDQLAARTKLVAVPSAGLTGELILIKYIQC